MTKENKYSVFIAEDMAPARDLLIDYISMRNELSLAGIAKNGMDALEKLTSETCDLLLLDIHLPVLSGIEMLEKLKNKPYVIFTTAYDKYAIKAFDVGAVDYLLKPIHIDRFNQAIDKFLIAIKNKLSSTPSLLKFGLSFMEKGKHYFISFKDILYLSSHGKHTVIHTEDRDFEAPSLIKEIEEKLPVEIFIRVHKQFVINIEFISHIQHNAGGKYFLFLKDSDESTIPVGRAYASSLKKKLDLK